MDQLIDAFVAVAMLVVGIALILLGVAGLVGSR